MGIVPSSRVSIIRVVYIMEKRQVFPYICLPSRARHWVPTPMPMPINAHAHGFWVGMGAILLGMGGHGFHIITGGLGFDIIVHR